MKTRRAILKKWKQLSGILKTLYSEEKGQAMLEYTILVIMVFYVALSSLYLWCHGLSEVIYGFAKEIFLHLGLP